MSAALASRAQPPLAFQVIASNPRSHHKRKREESGHSEPRAPNEKKRSKVNPSSTEKPKNPPARNAVVVQRAPKVNRGKDDDQAIQPKTAKLSVVSESKLAKRERRKAKREQGSTPHNDEAEENKPNGPSSALAQDAGCERAIDYSSSPTKNIYQENESQLEAAPTWKLSEPVGGRFIDSEPLFSADEKYLILAKDSHVEVYSSSTSSLVRSLDIGYRSHISAYSLSTVNPSILFVSTFSGTIYKWDWTEGKNLGRWDVSSRITVLATAATPNADQDIVYTVDQPEQRGEWMVTAHKLMAGKQVSGSEPSTLCRSQEPITGLKVMEGGNTVVATSGQRLMIGQRNDSNQTSFATTTYTWREVTLSEYITCFDPRLLVTTTQSQSAGAEKLQNRNSASKSSVDIVVANSKGEIYIYRDLFDLLIQRERPNKAGKAASLAASLQHWHREAVSTVKWSLDGNYIISGGVETVIVLWQLDTGARQYLPHLSSAIESLVVSPTGSSYAIRLSDNSVMVLSTTELKPTASIAGIQYQCSNGADLRQQHLVTAKSVMGDGLTGISTQPPKALTAINLLNPTQLMLAVSASQPTLQASVSTNRAVFLQTFDLATAQHISRQALARNNTTVVNIGGTGEKIREPDIRHMQVSHDGQWLATIDEWCAPVKEVEHLVTIEDIEDEQDSRREVFLNFWSWNAEAHEWQLVTRVDAPHGPTSPTGSGAGRVLAIAADPSVLGFASLGEDGVVCVWRPKIRRRNGIQVRDRNANGLVTWSCHRVTQMLHRTEPKNLFDDSLKAAIAFSEDGSLLIASLENSSMDSLGVVNFIDTLSGEIRHSRPGMYAGDLIDLAIVDRYLIILSDELLVWDMVDDELHFGLSLRSTGLSSQKRAAATHLTVNQRHRTFAIALPVLGNVKNRSPSFQQSQSRITIFDPSLPTPLYTTTLPRIVTSLLPATGSKGYVVLDSAAEVRILSPMAVPAVSNVTVDPETTIQPALGLDGIYGQAGLTAATIERDDSESSADEMDVVSPPSLSAEGQPEVYDDDDAPVVTQQQLAGVFDNGSAFAMPPVEQLFERVVGLFARKPRIA